MKKLISIIPFLFITLLNSAQNYQLLPDTCTFCSYFYTTGGNDWSTGSYRIDNSNDSTINTIQYIQVADMHIRQVGNKVFGIPTDSINEYLIMDFDAEIGDTLINLYSNLHLYNAIVVGIDSMVLNDGSYHHFFNLRGIHYSDAPNSASIPWEFSWHERGLCNSGPGFGNELGGLTMNIPIDDFSISPTYVSPSWCTPNPLYNNPDNNNCENCNGVFGSVKESNAPPRIYPNPTVDFINLEELNKFKVKVYSLTGMQLLNFNKSEEKLDVSILQPGIYCLRFFKGNVYHSSTFFIKN